MVAIGPDGYERGYGILRDEVEKLSYVIAVNTARIRHLRIFLHLR